MREPVIVHEQRNNRPAKFVVHYAKRGKPQRVEMPAPPEDQVALVVNNAKHLLCGFMSALVSKTILAPLERVKMDMVLRHRRGLVKTTSTIIAEEGYAGLWRGNLANLMRIAPFKAVNFFCYDLYRKALIPKRQAGEPEEAKPRERLLAGALAGMTACTLCFPLDLVRTRVLSSESYGSALGALGKIARQEGIGALYVGCVPAVISMAPAGAVFYGCYDLMKHQHLQRSAKAGEQDKNLPPAFTLLYGGLAGIMSECVVYPSEVVRRKMQMQSIPRSPSAGSRAAESVLAQARVFGKLRTAIVTIAQERGALGFYAGLLPCLAQVLPSAALSYYFFEACKRALHVGE